MKFKKRKRSNGYKIPVIKLKMLNLTVSFLTIKQLKFEFRTKYAQIVLQQPKNSQLEQPRLSLRVINLPKLFKDSSTVRENLQKKKNIFENTHKNLNQLQNFQKKNGENRIVLCLL